MDARTESDEPIEVEPGDEFVSEDGTLPSASAETYFYDDVVGDVRIQVWQKAGDQPWSVTFLPDNRRGHAPSAGRTLVAGDRNLPPDYPESNDPAELRDWAVAYARRRGAD